MTTQLVLLSGIEEKVDISVAADLIIVQAKARRFAEQCGLCRRRQYEFATAVSEAASNILKFAGKGTIVLRECSDPCPSVEFMAMDDGPGITDLASAMEDGFSEGRRLADELLFVNLRGIGSGLPAIKRLTDSLSITPGPGGGLRLVARKNL